MELDKLYYKVDSRKLSKQQITKIESLLCSCNNQDTPNYDEVNNRISYCCSSMFVKIDQLISLPFEPSDVVVLRSNNNLKYTVEECYYENDSVMVLLHYISPGDVSGQILQQRSKAILFKKVEPTRIISGGGPKQNNHW